MKAELNPFDPLPSGEAAEVEVPDGPPTNTSFRDKPPWWAGRYTYPNLVVGIALILLLVAFVAMEWQGKNTSMLAPLLTFVLGYFVKSRDGK